jgi:small subunit ribosomal protein S3
VVSVDERACLRNNHGSKSKSNRLPRRHQEDWRSRWYAPKSAYGEFLIEDFQVRKHIDAKLNRRPPFAAVSDIMIERTREEVTVTLKTARPGLVIGPKGRELDKLREELEDLIRRKIAPIKVIEIKNPDLNPQLVAEAIGEQLKKRASFRRVLKMRLEST